METDLRARALRLLARREHSRAELRRKLAPHAQEGVDLESLLDDFTSRGWLSEERFVEQAVRAKARRFGPLKIAHHLREKGIGEEAIARALRETQGAVDERLEAAWRSRFGEPPAGDADRARQVRFLQGRGFPLQAVLRFLKSR